MVTGSRLRYVIFSHTKWGTEIIPSTDCYIKWEKTKALWHVTELIEILKSVLQMHTLLNFVTKRLCWCLKRKKNYPQVFVPGSGVQYRPSKRKSIEGSFVSNTKSNKRRSKAYRNIHLGLDKQLQEAELILGQEDSDVPIDSSPPLWPRMVWGKFLGSGGTF